MAVDLVQAEVLVAKVLVEPKGSVAAEESGLA